MSSVIQESILLSLPPFVFSRVIYFLNQPGKIQLGITCMKLFHALTVASNEMYSLKERISIIDLYKVINMKIENRYYLPELVNHVLKYAPNLQVVHFAQRGKFEVEFMRMFLKVGKDKPFTYSVPEEEVDNFQLLIDFVGLSNITISKEISEPVTDVDVDTVVTPEEVNRRVAVIKKDMKRKFMDNHGNKVNFKTQLSHQLPLHCNQLFQTKNYAKIYMRDFKNNIVAKRNNIDMPEALELVEEVSPTFVESVCVFNTHWCLITSFSVFIHHQSHIDDCADKSRYPYQENPVAFIQKKTSFGSSSFELVIRVGYAEILANSGFIGSTLSTQLIPFVGSALQDLPEAITSSIETVSTTNIFKNSIRQEFNTGNRVINQYYKKTSALPWQFNSSRFSEDGFAPTNPLNLVSKHPWIDAGSQIIKTFAIKEINTEKIKNALDSIKRSDKPKEPKRYHQLIEHYLKKLDSCSQPEKSTFFNKSKKEDLVIKADMISIYNDLLAKYIKSANKKTVRIAAEKYKFKMIDLFNKNED